MSQFDVLRVRNTGELVVDCQADLLGHLPVRVVIPLAEAGQVLEPTGRLNPVFPVDGRDFILATQYMVSIPMAELEPTPHRLVDKEFEIVRSIDMLISGI